MPIHLLVPGLLGPWPDTSLQQPMPPFPVLERLLARADRRSAPSGYPRTLFSLLDMPFQPRESLPTASLCWLADSDEPLPGNILHADPVYLKPDMADVQLFKPQNLQPEQALAYARAFNDFYHAEGYRLYTPTPDRWYLSTPRPVRTPEASLDQVSGRNLRSFVAAGEQSRDWSSLFTEAQMLFHELPVNLARQAAGEMPVSGIWLSGGGPLPVTGDHEIGLVAGDDPLLRGAAMHAGVGCQAGPFDPEENVLIVRQGCHSAWLALDFSTWLEQVQQIETLLRGWIQARIPVILYPCNGRCWHWQLQNKMRLWRRKCEIADYVTTKNQ